MLRKAASSGTSSRSAGWPTWSTCDEAPPQRRARAGLPAASRGPGVRLLRHRRCPDPGRPDRPDQGARWSSRRRGRTSGSARAQRPHPGHRGRRRAAGASTATTTQWRGSATGRSSTRCSTIARAAARRPRPRSQATCARAGCPASGCWPAPSGCSTSASSASAARSTPRRTRPTAWPRCSSEHVTDRRRRRVTFDYTAKGGKRRVQTVVDPAVCEVVGGAQAPARRRRPELLAYRGARAGSGSTSARGDINDYLKEAGRRRPLGQGLPHLERDRAGGRRPGRRAASQQPHTARKRAVARAMQEVAEYLGNTPAVCRAVLHRPPGGRPLRAR